jgi:adenosylhomocysteine nucleosidase
MTPRVGSRTIQDRILVCFAVKEEAKAFRKALANKDGVSILVTGMGRRNTERAFRKSLKNEKPSFVFTCGFAGALDPNLKIGDVLFDADSSVSLDDALRSTGAEPGKFFCSERVAVTRAEKTELRRITGADAVEMESSIIRNLSREAGIQNVIVRAISDIATEDLPLDFNALMTADQQISMVKLLGSLLKSPGKVPQLLNLQRNTGIAGQRLAEVLCGLLNTLRNDRT